MSIHHQRQRSQKTIVPVLSEKDVYVGELLGQGAFSTIREVKRLKKKRSSQSRHENAHIRYDSCYAIKQVRDDLKSKNLSYAFKDLINEAAFLSILAHPNIIQIHGIGEVQNDSNSFLILERITCTMEEQCLHWKKRNKSIKKQLISRRTDKEELWNERLDVAKEFADAMAYLHRFNIIHRDIKMGNCGFGSQGEFKLFDFGLATNLKKEKRVAADQYKLSGFTGTYRYMAPEVFKCIPYGKPSDVYSFTLILWEIMSLTDIFPNETADSLFKNVHGESNYRPLIKSNWPCIFQELIDVGWSEDPFMRPSFVQIQEALEHCEFNM